jgi:hypothetical protein
MYNQYYDLGFRVVTLGLDWNSMNCSAWGETFELSLPVQLNKCVSIKYSTSVYGKFSIATATALTREL